MYCARWSNEAATVHANITDDHRDVPASCDVRNHDPILESWRLFQDEEVLLLSRANALVVDVVAFWNLWFWFSLRLACGKTQSCQYALSRECVCGWVCVCVCGEGVFK